MSELADAPYFLFAGGDRYYEDGGSRGFVGRFDSVEEACAAADVRRNEPDSIFHGCFVYEWAEVATLNDAGALVCVTARRSRGWSDEVADG